MKKNYTPLKGTLLFVLSFLLYTSGTAQNVWINEIHYDNFGTDVNEFIEVVLENPGSYSLPDFEIYLYNGNGGAFYDVKSLDLFTVGASSGNFTFYYYTYPANGIQNGAPDGMALVYQGTVVTDQFLSYEGTLTASDGPAAGLTSVDIGVAEPGQIGESLQLSGNGTQYSDFVWNPPATETPGNLNNNQGLGGPSPEPSNYPTAFMADAHSLSITLTWTDATGAQLPDGYLIKASEQNNITSPVDGTPVPDDTDLSDGEGALNVSYGVETAVFHKLNSETEYFFKIYSYTNAGPNIDYKTDGTPPSAQATTAFAINTNDFEDGDFETWTTYNVASDKDWQVVDYGGAYNTTWFAQMNGYNEDVPSNDWLISPAMDLNSYNNEMILFLTQWKYGNTDTELKLKYSTDYTGGDPTAASWTELSFTKPATEDTWESSGDVDLSSISGDNVYVAFQYLSSGNPRRWGVDEIEITGDPITGVINVISPEGGDKWEQGSTHDILWSASNTLPNVKIELTTNASQPTPDWTELATGIPASQGSWTWNIPPDQTTSYDCKIRIADYASETVGYSGIFWIIEPVVTPDLTISEIMYNPPESGTDSAEFIEVYNNDAATIDLDGYSFRDGIEFDFPDMELAPGEYILIAKDSLVMVEIFGANAWQWTDGSLSNSGESLVIVDNLDYVVDSVYYEDIAPWPLEPDGNGPSLTFCDYTLDNALGENWSASIHVAGFNAAGDTLFATPGYGCIEEPIADFSADVTTVTVGGSVNFTDQSQNNPNSWSWTFESGTPDSYEGQDPPPIVYNTAGEFDVTLTVTNEAGESTEIKENYITVSEGPVADFEASATAIDIGGTVDFTDLSAGDPDTWSWTFEGGTPDTSSTQNPTAIQYNTMGLYDVTLTVSNMFGTNTLTKEDYIKVGPVGIGENGTEAFSIYPNPNNGTFTINCDPEQVSQIEVYGIMGQLINTFVCESSQLSVRISSGQKGIYFIRFVSGDGKSQTRRMLVN